MPDYSYRAIDDTGKLYRGTIIAIDEDDVEKRLLEERLTLIKSSPVKRSMPGRQSAGGRVKPRILIEFYYRLSQVMELGLPLLSALDENAKSLPSKVFQKVVGEVRVSIESGNTLYEAMGLFPKIFNKLDLGIIKMGEQSGVLPGCLKELAGFLEWKEDIRSTIKRATIYPAFTIIVIGAVIGVWVGHVLPQMAKILTEMGVALPGLTQAVLGTSLFITTNWPWITCLILLSAFAFYMFQRTKKGGMLLHKYLLKAPLIGNVVTNTALARLSHNFATMYRAGMAIDEIFETLKDNILGNRYLEERLAGAFNEILRGRSIAEGFENAGAFPPLLLGAIKNGELTGTLDDSFKRLGDYYDSEVKRTVQAMINAIEPATLLLLGSVFGIIILSIILPLYDVIGDFGKAY